MIIERKRERRKNTPHWRTTKGINTNAKRNERKLKLNHSQRSMMWFLQIAQLSTTISAQNSPKNKIKTRIHPERAE